MKKIEYKYIAISLIIIVLFLIVSLIIFDFNKYDFGNMQIEKTEFENIANIINSEGIDSFMICDIDKDECIKINSLDKILR